MAVSEAGKSDLRGLIDQMKKSIELSKDDEEEFLPLGALDRFITPENVMSRLPTLSTTLVDFICKHAKKTFAILLYTGMDEEGLEGVSSAAVIESFKAHEFTDALLPIDRNTSMDHCRVQTSRKCSHDRGLNVFHDLPWTQRKIHAFYCHQWKLMAPVFTEKQDTYPLQYKCPLPFTWIGETYRGKVNEVEIHKDHQLVLPQIEGMQPHFALKSFSRSKDGSVEKVIKKLSRMSALKHPHIRSLIATITKVYDTTEGNRDWMMFQWSEGDNLEELWQANKSPNLDGGFIEETLQQLLGLTDALRVLHENNIKHGSLEPSRILRSKHNKNKKLGTFQIVGPSISSSGYTDSSLRQPTRGLLHSFIAFQDPERRTKSTAELSRYNDIWSAGFIILELIIWLLYGTKELQYFRNEAKNKSDDLGAGRGDVEIQSSPVKRWISHISQDPECQKTALGDLLQFVDKKLLVGTKPAIQSAQGIPSIVDAENEYRASAKQLYEEIGRIVQKVEKAPKDSKYLFKNTGGRKGPGRLQENRKRGLNLSPLWKR